MHKPEGRMVSNSTQSPRYDFEPMIYRQPVRFPKGERLAVLIYVNIEHVPFGSKALAHAIHPGTLQFSPDILNHGWRDYGNRVGLWRIMDAMDKHGFRGTLNLKIIEEGTGMRPKGWLSMCLAESFVTPDLLAEAGIEYVSNYTHDELPVPMRVKSGSLLTMPYTLEINDVPAIMVKGSSAEVFGRMIRDQFDVLYEEGQKRPRIMSISVHPFISGHPFRMKHIEAALEYVASHADVWRTTGLEINNWYRANYLRDGHAG